MRGKGKSIDGDNIKKEDEQTFFLFAKTEMERKEVRQPTERREVKENKNKDGRKLKERLKRRTIFFFYFENGDWGEKR